MDFHLTPLGIKFFSYEFPQLVKEVKRLADAVEEHNRIELEKLKSKEKENK